MIVIADTSPLNYLILIGEIELLPKLLGQVIIPKAVFDELQAKETPLIVQAFFKNLPDWLELREAQLLLDEDLDGLDLGEREAIILAEDLSADALLIDERDGREVALNAICPFSELWVYWNAPPMWVSSISPKLCTN